MPAVSASSSVEKILLPEADQHDLKKSKKKIFWENRKVSWPLSPCTIIDMHVLNQDHIVRPSVRSLMRAHLLLLIFLRIRA